MKDFFRQHLDLFPGASELKDLRIYSHSPTQVISHTVTLVKYELDIKYDDGTVKTEVVRGSADQANKRKKAFRVLQTLRQHGFSHGPFQVPRPLGYFEEFHMLLYENFPGQTLMQQFQQGRNDFLPKIKKSLDWLACFHNSKPQMAEEAHSGAEDELRDFKILIVHLCEKFNTQAERIDKLSQAIQTIQKEMLTPDKYTLVHGDFQPNNILTDGQTTTVIDFNDSFLYDELFDLTYFITQTRFMFKTLRGQDLGEELAIMKDEYLAARGIPNETLTQKKIALFSAKTLLRIKILADHDLGKKILTEIEDYVKKAV